VDRGRFLILLAAVALSAPAHAKPRKLPGLVERLDGLREQIDHVQKSLYEEMRGERSVQLNVRKLQTLGRLQKKERELGQLRMLELENTVHELEDRRQQLRSRTVTQQAAIRRFLAALARAHAPDPLDPAKPKDRLDGPRRRVLANLIERGIKEIEAYKVDLADADQLERNIREEKRQLSNLFQDLDEQETVLEMNKQLQDDLIAKHEGERLDQMENYRKLKTAESQVEDLLKQFNAHAELEKTVEAEREAYRGARDGGFAALQGRLPLPVSGGRVISGFGKTFDSQSQLYVFRKGITIDGGNNASVKAVSGGRVAFAGELPDYGQVTIVDHGDHYYTLCAHLGELSKRTGDIVMAGDPIGVTDSSGTPVYFEIRDRNIAVNPLQWVAN
jgi:septal ring factor EnvC (AmiA/AmiB activator)